MNDAEQLVAEAVDAITGAADLADGNDRHHRDVAGVVRAGSDLRHHQYDPILAVAI